MINSEVGHTSSHYSRSSRTRIYRVRLDFYRVFFAKLMDERRLLMREPSGTAYAFAGLRGDGSLLLWGVECPSVLGCSWTNRRNPRNDHDHVTRRSTIQSHCRKQRRNHTKTPNTFSTVSRRSHDEHGRPGRRPWGRRVGLQAPRAAMLTPWPPSATIAMASLIANDAF